MAFCKLKLVRINSSEKNVHESQWFCLCLNWFTMLTTSKWISRIWDRQLSVLQWSCIDCIHNFNLLELYKSFTYYFVSSWNDQACRLMEIGIYFSWFILEILYAFNSVQSIKPNKSWWRSFTCIFFKYIFLYIFMRSYLFHTYFTFFCIFFLPSILCMHWAQSLFFLFTIRIFPIILFFLPHFPDHLKHTLS